MVIMPIPKDVRKFKTKIFMSFTLRQISFILIGGALGCAVKFGLGNVWTDEVGKEACNYLMMFVMAPFVMCGYVDIQDMPIYVYAKEVLINRYFGHKRRPYRTVNIYENLAVQNKITYEYFDDVDDSFDKKGRKKSEKRIKKEHEKRLEKFLKENPDLKPIS